MANTGSGQDKGLVLSCVGKVSLLDFPGLLEAILQAGGGL